MQLVASLGAPFTVTNFPWCQSMRVSVLTACLLPETPEVPGAHLMDRVGCRVSVKSTGLPASQSRARLRPASVQLLTAASSTGQHGSTLQSQAP